MGAADDVIKLFKSLADETTAKHSQRFFKTGKGEYGEGDRFLGIRVPVIRKQIKQFKTLTLTDSAKLLKSPYHEIRLFTVILLVQQYQKADLETQTKIFQLYTSQTKYINNWDIIDISAPRIVGAYLHDKDKKLLYEFARSRSLWKKRIAMLATYFFIQKHEYKDALAIANILVNDEHDLIQKAVGWMLREIGKRNLAVEEAFLDQHAKQMPRTMLRYAIEQFDAVKRKNYMTQ